ncbi:hypothetical protein X907_2371 [Glycocaulis alkaliphilus]|uniref:Uncharacterized protein n=1 Tax=Glycocaulis alkaliphilus TaxID=1434191 RepID=A0A3T0EC66_9PROT|nr:hypothetical protein X907_2371 [Glycocaulis alkaliphilus]
MLMAGAARRCLLFAASMRYMPRLTPIATGLEPAGKEKR